MDVQTLLAKMAEQREFWADLPGGKRIKLRRPPEVELPALMHGVKLEHLTEYACGWDGFTEADLLGPAIGKSDPQPFHVDLWDAYMRDHAECVKPAVEALRDSVTDYLKRKAETEKNSAPSST